jgi:hypothetical protein
MDVGSLVEFKDLAERYPYCQSLHILHLLNLRCLKEDMFDMVLSMVAIRVADRALLKQQVNCIDRVEGILLQRPPVSSKNLSQKTISDFLRLPKTVFDKKTLPNTPSHSKIPKIPLPQTSHSDVDFLELMRQEALSKINRRLADLRQPHTGDTSTLLSKLNKPPKNNRLSASRQLIDAIIENNPKISPISNETTNKKLSVWKTKEAISLREDYELVSETLAKLYLSQGATKKAMDVYKNLSKKFPDKKPYFDSAIKKIRKN